MVYFKVPSRFLAVRILNALGFRANNYGYVTVSEVQELINPLITQPLDGSKGWMMEDFDKFQILLDPNKTKKENPECYICFPEPKEFKFKKGVTYE